MRWRAWKERRMQLDISELIRRVNAGEPGAQDVLFSTAYGELRQLRALKLGRVIRHKGQSRMSK